MKYPNWDGYTDEQKDKAVAEELWLETQKLFAFEHGIQPEEITTKEVESDE